MAERVDGDMDSAATATEAPEKTDSPSVGPQEGLDPQESGGDLNLDRLLNRIRNEAMYELRKLKHQHRPVSDFCSKQDLETFFSQRNQCPRPPSRGAEGGEAGNTRESETTITERARRFSSGPQAPDPQSLMPEAIRLEVHGLMESQRVSGVLQSPELHEAMERSLREALERRRRRQQGRAGRNRSQNHHQEEAGGGGRRNPLASIRSSHGRRSRPRGNSSPRQPRVRFSPRHRPPRLPTVNENGQYPLPPRRNQSRIVAQVRQSSALNTLPPEERDRVVAEIGHLVQQQFVTTALSGEFRGVLELHIQERAERIQQGVGSEDYVQSALGRRSEHSASAAAAYSKRSYDPDEPSQASYSELREEMSEMKAQLLELKQMMRVSFDLQLDIQRAIRQEVAAALAAFCTPPTDASDGAMAVGPPPSASAGHCQLPTTGGSQPAHVIDSGNCVICSEGAIDSVVYRCGHMCVCMACGLELKAQGLKCPICRAPITDIVRAYASMVPTD